MKRWITTALGSIMAATIAASTANADDRNYAGKRFERIDADNDGRITLEEMMGRVDDRFDAADTDRDGVISMEEMIARIERRRLERRARRMLNRMDFDGDGKVTKTELKNRARKRFALADRNDDGVVEKSEMRKRGRKHRGHGRRHDRRRMHSDEL